MRLPCVAPERRATGRRAGARRALAASLVSCALVACGYSTGLVAPEGAESVGVEIFGNESYVRDIELELTQLVASRLGDLVSVPVTTPSQADLVVRGTILDYRRRAGVRTLENTLLEQGLRVQIQGELVDRRTGEVISSTPPGGIGIWSGYVKGQLDSEGRALSRALESLSERLILDLFHDVSYEDLP